jgi:hypothetical protein
MKNKILTATIALAALFIANQASAYYSPSTGRWLSRDPMGEPGFETLRSASAVPKVGQIKSIASLPPSRLFVRDSIAAKNSPNRYCFVDNGGPNKYDVLGLSGCNCGPDITQSINKMLLEVDNAYDSWSELQRCSACAALYLNWWSGWDVDLFKPPGGYPGTDDGPCRFTFTYNGTCYYAGSLNYALFGRASALCGYSLLTTLLAVGDWKTYGHGEDPGGVITQQAMSMASNGYGSPASGPDIKSCPPSDKKTSDHLQWKWGPHSY